jgi:hypothetical protein
MERFGASWDAGLRLSTWLFVGLMLVLGAAMMAGAWAASTAAGGPVLGLWIGGAGLMAGLPLVWALAPRGFALEGGELVVERPLWPVRIPLASVRAVTVLPRPGLGWAIRTAGCSGVFGHYGHFWSRSLGSFRLYATRRDPLVCVDGDAGRFVLSPDEPERFVAAVLRQAPRARHDPGRALPAAGPRPGRAWVVVGAISLAVLVAGGIVLGSLAWAPRGAEVTDTAVRIERRWAGPVLLPLAGIRAAERLAPGYAAGWRRVNGTSGLGDASFGHFASRQLGDFTLYAWRRGPYVLLETDAGRVVLTPDDPEGFLEALRARRPAARP